MKKLLLIWLGVLLAGSAIAQQTRTISGIVKDEKQGLPLAGVNIILKGSSVGTISNLDGEFSLELPAGGGTLSFSYIGYLSREVLLDEVSQGTLEVILEEDMVSLQAFELVSTGFQELSPERTTGSFSKLNEKLINRRISTNILDRLEDVTPGLLVTRDVSGADATPSIIIRGTSTIRSDSQPLIVIDNLTYDGPISSINPNDVESMTVLKDAAAASIWGARAGNGVIVITTKKGKMGSALQVSLNVNANWGQKQDAFYLPKMSVASLIDKEQSLFGSGYYNGQINSGQKPRLSPAVESLNQYRAGLISEGELQNQLDGYSMLDVRSDLEQYFYRPSLNQQYSLGIRGGSDNYTYAFSTGWDSNRGSRVTDYNSRFTLSSNQTWSLLDKKLQLGAATYYTVSQSESALPDINNFYAYDRLADESGSPLAVSRSYSERFKESVRNTDLLNWDYVPLDEIGLSPERANGTDLRLNASLDYQLLPGLNLKGFYQYWSNISGNSFLQPIESYTTRELINNFSAYDDSGILIQNIPAAGILDQGQNTSHSHTFRGQLTYDKRFAEYHQLNVLAGMEVKDQHGEGSTYRSYGYDDLIGISQPVSYGTRYRQFSTGFQSSIPFRESYTGTVNHYLSGFVNLGYSFQDKYLFTGSARVDKSNLFGVNTNQKSVPLWSAGIGWIVSEEDFLQASWISFMKFRASYGYNGNTNSRATAFTTGRYFSAGSNRLVGEPFLGNLTAPNPELRWERIKIVNLGLDYELAKGKWYGSLEYYSKQGLDLLGEQALFPSTGFYSATLNYASTATKGVDLSVNSRHTFGDFTWTGSFYYSYVNERVIDFQNEPTSAQIMSSQPGAEVPVKERPLYHVYSYPWAGLNQDTGAPMGYLEGAPSEDYQSMLQMPEDQLIFHGSSRPTSFGALRNTFDYKEWSISFNISYRLGYYFRDLSVNYNNVNFGQQDHADYEMRWQKPGDQTQIPSDPQKVDSPRNAFYLRSSALVEKADNIRLQDVRLSYRFDGSSARFRNMEIYAYANNLGIIWKATDRDLDPEYRFNQAPKTLALGLRISF